PVLARCRHPLGRRALRGHRGDAVFAFVEPVVGWAKRSAPTRLSRIGTKLRVGTAHAVKFALRGKPLARAHLPTLQTVATRFLAQRDARGGRLSGAPTGAPPRVKSKWR